jgi:hypothetical protein
LSSSTYPTSSTVVIVPSGAVAYLVFSASLW